MPRSFPSKTLRKSCAPLSDEALNARPSGIAPVAFHLRHIVLSLDRLLTYAEGGQLNAAQMTALKTELIPTQRGLNFSRNSEREWTTPYVACGTLLEWTLEQPRSVGRKALPTSVGGLLVHCADHTQRHTGQAVTTAKMVQAARS